jgi:hypothetical protein
MDYNDQDVREYVPEWNNNRDKGDDSIVIELVPMTGGELRAAQRASVGRDGKVSVRAAENAIKKIIEGRVTRLDNCVDILDRPISNGLDLWERGEQKLIDECYSAITEISTLSEGARKK